MPRPLDVEKRKSDIARIAFEILGRVGPRGLTLQAVAAELGGSVTKVTHIYRTRAELMRGTVERYIELAPPPGPPDGEADPLEHLRGLLADMIPQNDNRRLQERGRVAIIGDKDQESARVFADGMEDRARRLLRGVLTPLVPADDLESAIDFCRATVNGITLSTVEHPEHWTPERQRTMVDLMVRTVAGMRDA